MIGKILVGIGVIALVLALGSHPAVLTDIGTTAHDALNMFK